MLELVNVSKSYDSPDSGQGLCVLKDINLAVTAGKSVAIVGPSGSGKSTLLNIAGAIDKASSGKVLLDSIDLGTLDDSRLAKIRNRQIGFVFQLHHLLPQCTALENVLIPTLAGRMEKPPAEYKCIAEALLQRVGLKDRLNYLPGRLSGGERQRIAVARALVNGPKLLLADEPTGSLDAESAEKIAELLCDLNRNEKVTVIMVTHSMHLAERMGKIFLLAGGTLTEDSRR